MFTVAVLDVKLFVVSTAWYASVPTMAVDWIVNEAQPLLVVVGFAETIVVNVPETLSSEMESPLFVVMVLVDPSLTQAVNVAVATPLAGRVVASGRSVSTAAGPKPVNEAEPDALVRAPEVAVAVHVSALESLRTKSTFPEVLVGAVATCVPAPAVRAGVALPICAVHEDNEQFGCESEDHVRVTYPPAGRTFHFRHCAPVSQSRTREGPRIAPGPSVLARYATLLDDYVRGV